MEIKQVKHSYLNQNGYNKNSLTKERIGTLFIYPIDFTPDDCLSCDGYSLLIEDYKELYSVIGTKFNQVGDAEGTFRVPDYNISGRFLQPHVTSGIKIEAGLPNHYHTVVAFYWNYPGAAEEGRGNPDYGNHLALTTSWASECNPIYGNSATVQPPSQTVHLVIKYK